MGKEVYSVQNCFMFQEETSPPPLNKAKNTSLAQSGIMEFRTDKPYRLALYVQPTLKRRIDLTNSNLLANLSKLRRERDKENITNTKNKKKSNPKEKSNISLFDEENETNKTENNSKKIVDRNSSTKAETSKILKNSSILSYVNVNESTKKKQTTELDVSNLPKAKQRKIRRSYEKKFKEYADSEKIVEPPSDQILKEMDLKKVTRSKVKKPNKEEQEYEKWAENMNSAFDDIDKFELSINYD